MKKSAVFLALICILSLMAPLGALGAVSFVNGGFESASDSIPGWTAEGGSFGTALQLDAADPAEGTQALLISSAGQASAVQTVTVTAGNIYTVSGYWRADRVSSGGSVSISAECGTENYGETVTAADGAWKAFSFFFTAEDGTCAVTLSVTNGTACFDGITFTESGVLLNGSFSELSSGGYPIGWRAYDGWGTTDKAGTAVYESVLAEGYSGNAVLISNLTEDEEGNAAADRNPYISQSVACDNSAYYTLSGYFKADSASSVVIKLEHYAGNSNFSSNNRSLQGDGSWKAFSIPISTSEDQTRFGILLRILGKGEVAFDEISLTYNGKKETARLRVEPEDIFAYDDKVTGRATVTVPGSVAAGSRVVLSLSDGSTTLFSMSQSAADTVVFSYDNTKMTELGKAYTLRAKLTTGGGSVLAESSETIYRYPRPTHLNPEGFFVNHDGQTVYPVTAYHVPLADYEKLAEIGVNVVQCIYTSAYPDSIAAALDKAEKLGLYLMIPLYADMKTAGSDHNRERTVACIERFKNHPALYAWMVMDEPQPYYDAVYEELKASYKLIRDLDPAHPVYICECNPESYALSGRCCDILCIDPYPDTPEDMARVYDDTVLALEATNYEKPVYNLLQAWKWTEWEPSAGELRQMIYQALFAGAAAYGYYPIRDSSSTMYNLPLWSGAVSFAAYEKEALYKAFLEGDAPKVQKTDTCYYAESGSYIFVINRTGNETSVTIPTSLSGTPVLINGAAEVQKSTEGITVQLSDFGAACIEMTDEARVSLWKDGIRAHRVESGTYAVKTANETEGQIFTALYEEVNGKRELMNLVVGAATFAVDCKSGKKYEIRVYCWKDGVPQTEIFAIS